MNNNFNSNLTIQGDRSILEAIASKYHKSSGKILDDSDIVFDCLEFDDEDLRLHYESSNEQSDAIAIFSGSYPNLTFVINYDSYPDNVSGMITIVNGKIVTSQKIPREIVLRVSLWELGEIDFPQVLPYQEIAIAISRELENLITGSTWDTNQDSILRLIQGIEEEN
jgi:hypothetical protein